MKKKNFHSNYLININPELFMIIQFDAAKAA